MDLGKIIGKVDPFYVLSGEDVFTKAERWRAWSRN